MSWHIVHIVLFLPIGIHCPHCLLLFTGCWDSMSKSSQGSPALVIDSFKNQRLVNGVPKLNKAYIFGSHHSLWPSTSSQVKFEACRRLCQCHTFIALFWSILVLCGTDNTLHNISRIILNMENIPAKYCQSHITLLWIWILLCQAKPTQTNFQVK